MLYRNKVWSFGGDNTRQACVFNCAQDSWDQLPEFPQDSGGSYACQIDRLLWIHGYAIDDFYTFNPDT